MCFDEPPDDVEAAGFERMRLAQHREGLADAGRGADVHAQSRLSGRLHLHEVSVEAAAKSRPKMLLKRT